jgi:hypothetical protein
MKPKVALISLSFFVLLASCSHSKAVPQDKIILKTTSIQNGKETLTLLKNKSLDTATVNGYLSYQLKENPTTDVVRFSYEKDLDKAEVDGGLREEVLFEIQQSDFSLALTDAELQKTKMIFGRYCYCRGQNGIVPITDGNLNISRQKDQLLFSLEFHSKNLPQAFDKINSK